MAANKMKIDFSLVDFWASDDTYVVVLLTTVDSRQNRCQYHDHEKEVTIGRSSWAKKKLRMWPSPLTRFKTRLEAIPLRVHVEVTAEATTAADDTSTTIGCCGDIP
jgi:hypothetical protein